MIANGANKYEIGNSCYHALTPGMYRRECIRAATDLGYSSSAIDAIRRCKTTDEMSKVMEKARVNDGRY